MKTLTANNSRPEVIYYLKVAPDHRPFVFFSCGTLVAVEDDHRFHRSVLGDIANQERKDPDDLDFASVSILPLEGMASARLIEWKSGEFFGGYPGLPGKTIALAEEIAEKFRLLIKDRLSQLPIPTHVP